MKRLLLEWAIYLAAATIYSAWKYRGEVFEVFEDDLLDRARYQQAIQQTLRSIRKLPETGEDK